MDRTWSFWAGLTGLLVLVSGCWMPRQRLVEPVYMGANGPLGTVTAPTADPLRFPRLSMKMPEGPILDLGVVVMPDIAHVDRQVLLRIADELGADGFVIERRTLASVYELPDSLKDAMAKGQRRAVDEVPKGLEMALDVASFAAVVAGCAVSDACAGLGWRGAQGDLGGEPWRSTEADGHTYVRAYRQGEGGTSRGIPVEIVLAQGIREALESFSSQADQLVALHAMLAQGLLSLGEYGALRASLSSES